MHESKAIVAGSKKKIRDHRDLRVWRKARRLAELAASVSEAFPPEKAKLTATFRRLSDDIANEIALGQSRGQYAHYVEHLERSRAAARHLERKVIEAHRAGLVAAAMGDPLLAQIAEIVRMIGKLLVSLEIAHSKRRSNRIREG